MGRAIRVYGSFAERLCWGDHYGVATTRIEHETSEANPLVPCRGRVPPRRGLICKASNCGYNLLLISNYKANMRPESRVRRRPLLRNELSYVPRNQRFRRLGAADIDGFL